MTGVQYYNIDDYDVGKIIPEITVHLRCAKSGRDYLEWCRKWCRLARWYTYLASSCSSWFAAIKKRMIRNHRLFFVLGPLPNFYRKMLTVVHFALTILVSVSSDSSKKKSSILAAPGAGGCGGTVDPGFLIALHTPVPTKKEIARHWYSHIPRGEDFSIVEN